jgi:hypothetical protein
MDAEMCEFKQFKNFRSTDGGHLGPREEWKGEKKRKKGGDEGSNGVKLPFPLASSIH